eukprot:gene31678-38283_t
MSWNVKVSLGETLFPYTAVDKYFDHGFIFQPSHPERGINSPAIWQECMEALQTLAVTSRKEYQVQNDSYSHIFQIAVEGYMQHNEDPKEVMQQSWLCWRGKYIDPAYIYTPHYNGYGLCTHLTRLCPVTSKPNPEVLRERGEMLVEKSFQYTRKRRLQGGKKNSLRKGVGILVGNMYNSHGRVVDIAAHNLVYDIELGSVQFVHSIGMRAGYPRNRSHFPANEDLLALELHDGLDPLVASVNAAAGRRRLGKYVQVVRGGAVACVSAFKLAYWVEKRAGQGGGWKELRAGQGSGEGSFFKGNNDADTEVFVGVGAYTRKLRIYVQEYQRFPDCSVRVYGRQEEADASAVGRKDRKTGVGVDAAEAQEVVEYRVMQPLASLFKSDGGGWGHDRWTLYEKQMEKKKQRMKLAVELRNWHKFADQY